MKFSLKNKLIKTLVALGMIVLGPRRLLKIYRMFSHRYPIHLTSRDSMVDVRSLFQSPHPRGSSLVYLFTSILKTITPKSFIRNVFKRQATIDLLYSSKLISPSSILFTTDTSVISEIRFVVMDVPLDRRAGSYLRLFRICKALQSLGYRTVVLNVNTEETTKHWWSVSDTEFKNSKNRWQAEGIQIHHFYSYLDARQIHDRNAIYWLHDLSSARAFFDFSADKFVFGFRVLDLVDLEFRRLAQASVSPSMVADNIEFLKFAIRRCHQVISISMEEQKIIKEICLIEENKTSVVSNIYPKFESIQRNTHDKKYDFLFIGNFLHLPNVEALEYIVSTLAPENPTCRIAIVGAGAPKHLMQNNRLSNIYWHGPVEDLHELYSASHSVIAPLFSGAGVKGKVIEALNFGVPVIGTEIAWEGIPVPRKPFGWVVYEDQEYINALAEIRESINLSLDMESCSELNSRFGEESAKLELARLLERIR